MPDLTSRHYKFITAYLRDGIGSKAVIEAGWSATGASVTANRLLKNPKVAAELARRRAVSQKKAELTAEVVFNELRNLVTSNIKDLYDEHGNLKPINELPDEVAKTISSLEMAEKGCGVKKLKTHSKLGALELSARLLGLVAKEQQAQASVTILLANPPEIPPAPATPLLPIWE